MNNQNILQIQIHLPTHYHKGVIQNFCISNAMPYLTNAPVNPAKCLMKQAISHVKYQSEIISQSVQVGISKQHMGTQCYCFEFSKYKGMPKYIHEQKYWENFINFLEQHHQLKDFISLTRGLKSGRINPNNLSWISALHMGRYSNCSSTTGM